MGAWARCDRWRNGLWDVGECKGIFRQRSWWWPAASGRWGLRGEVCVGSASASWLGRRKSSAGEADQWTGEGRRVVGGRQGSGCCRGGGGGRCGKKRLVVVCGGCVGRGIEGEDGVRVEWSSVEESVGEELTGCCNGGWSENSEWNWCWGA